MLSTSRDIAQKYHRGVKKRERERENEIAAEEKPSSTINFSSTICNDTSASVCACVRARVHNMRFGCLRLINVLLCAAKPNSNAEHGLNS